MDNINAQVFSQPPQVKKFWFSPKIIFVVLGIIILVEVVFAIKTLTSPVPAPTQSANNAGVQSGVQPVTPKISLTTSKTSFKVGEIIPVSVIVDTGKNAVSGVDLVVKFDPKVLEVNTAGLVKGTIFSEYPLLSVDSKAGFISISGISNTQSNFRDKGQFAQINLKAKSAGQASLVINFQKGSTADSNLVDAKTSKNILEIVDNLNFEIK